MTQKADFLPKILQSIIKKTEFNEKSNKIKKIIQFLVKETQ